MQRRLSARRDCTVLSHSRLMPCRNSHSLNQYAFSEKSFEIIVFNTGGRELQTKLLHVQGC